MCSRQVAQASGLQLGASGNLQAAEDRWCWVTTISWTLSSSLRMQNQMLLPRFRLEAPADPQVEARVQIFPGSLKMCMT